MAKGYRTFVMKASFWIGWGAIPGGVYSRYSGDGYYGFRPYQPLPQQRIERQSSRINRPNFNNLTPPYPQQIPKLQQHKLTLRRP